MSRFYGICRGTARICMGMFWGLLFGTFFLSGLAFLSGRQIYYEISDSMRPVIEKGSLLFVREQEEYRPGDIVAFYVLHEGQAVCVTHRIVERTAEETYITKGDANDREDRMVIRKGQIAGIVTEYIPWFGYICFFVQKNSTLLLALFLFSLLWKG